MDGQQRKKYATQTLRDMQDPEKVHVLRTLLGSTEREKETAPVRPESTKEKLWGLWSSTAGGAAICLLIGAYVSQLSLHLLYVGVWGVLFFEALRVRLFETRSRMIVGNSAIAVI